MQCQEVVEMSTQTQEKGKSNRIQSLERAAAMLEEVADIVLAELERRASSG